LAFQASEVAPIHNALKEAKRLSAQIPRQKIRQEILPLRSFPAYTPPGTIEVLKS